MTYDNVRQVLFIILFAGIMIYEIVYFLGIRRDYKCVIDLAKSELVIKEVKDMYFVGLSFLILGVALCAYGICYFTLNLLNS